MGYQNYHFELPYGKITSVVMDQTEFDDFCDALETSNVFVSNSDGRVTKEVVDKIRVAKHLPCMRRGLLTESFFKRFGVRTNLLCAIVRGEGRNLVQDLYGKLTNLKPD